MKNFIDFHKTRGYQLCHIQNLLFDLADLPPAVKYEKLFENLPMLKENIPKTGRRPISRNCMFKGINLQVIKALSISDRPKL